MAENCYRFSVRDDTTWICDGNGSDSGDGEEIPAVNERFVTYSVNLTTQNLPASDKLTGCFYYTDEYDNAGVYSGLDPVQGDGSYVFELIIPNSENPLTAIMHLETEGNYTDYAVSNVSGGSVTYTAYGDIQIVGDSEFTLTYGGT